MSTRGQLGPETRGGLRDARLKILYWGKGRKMMMRVMGGCGGECGID